MKVSLYFEDDLWSKFKKNVLRRTGNSRTLSSEVQRLLQESLVEECVRAGFENMEIEVKPLSSNQVIAVRPSVSTSSSATLKKMRESRLGQKLYLDSSTIVKRYIEETGSESVSLLYAKSDVQELTLCFSIWNVGETIGVIDFYRKRGWITEDQGKKAFSNFASETMRLVKFEALELLNVSSAVLTECWELIRKHHVYQTDALQIVECKRAGADVLISADRALLQAARREGLTGINVENASEVHKQIM